MRSLIILFFLISFSISKDLEPSFSFFVSGGVNDIVKNQNRLYLATSSSSVDIFDLEKQKIERVIKIPKIKDFTDSIIDSKVFSVDALNGKTLILSQGKSGGRDIFIEENGELKNIINSEDRLFIAYAKFLDNNRIIYALLSNQIYIYDINENKILKELHVSFSSFSNFILSPDLSHIFVSDEGGVVSKIDTKELKIVKKFEGQNVDRVFEVDYKNGTILACGQDRRAALYFEDNNSSYYKNIGFLVYAGALNSDATKAAVSLNEENDVLVFNINSKQEEYILKGNISLISSILFLTNDSLVVGSDDKKVNIFKLK